MRHSLSAVQWLGKGTSSLSRRPSRIRTLVEPFVAGRRGWRTVSSYIGRSARCDESARIGYRVHGKPDSRSRRLAAARAADSVCGRNRPLWHDAVG
eukprot:7391111-Prymnesium_polylepis.1